MALPTQPKATAAAAPPAAAAVAPAQAPPVKGATNDQDSKNVQDSNTASNKAKKGGPPELLLRYARLITYVVVAVGAYAFTCPLERAHTLQLDWILMVLARNLAVCWLCYGGWHWFLYDSPWGSYNNETVAALKFNKANQYGPGLSNLRREQLYTTLGFVMSTAFEVCVLHLWASGRWVQPYYLNLWDYPCWSLMHAFSIAYIRDGHFYFIHRFMHAWRWTVMGVDIGAVIYKRVHSLHHKSYNPGPWSGLSMHPLEHLLYYTCTLTPFLFSLHPIHFYFNKFHADLSPLPGHDGHNAPAGGSHFHYLHHAHFECNYGTPLLPFDKWFGTYEDGSKWEGEKSKYD